MSEKANSSQVRKVCEYAALAKEVAGNAARAEDKEWYRGYCAGARMALGILAEMNEASLNSMMQEVIKDMEGDHERG